MIALLLGIVGGILYRFRGGWPDIPRPIEQMLFCLPIGYAAINEHWWLAIIVYGLSVAATLRGHGKHMDLAAYTLPADDEWYEPLIKWIKPHIPEYWYDVIGIGVSGLFITLPLILVNPLLAPIGALKSVAYMIGWSGIMPPIVLGKFELDHETAWGEFLTGFFIWTGLILLI